MPFDKISLFTGNQFGKTAGCVINYIFRIMGWHPIPKKNVMFFECPKLVKEEEEADKSENDDAITHPWIVKRLPDGSYINIHREGQYFDSVFYPSHFPRRYRKSLRPENNLCTFCGEKLKIHQRKSRIFRFSSEVLPAEKETGGGEGEQSTEIKNVCYPELKKWLPKFLIKKDITARRSAVTISDPNAGQKFGDLEYNGADIVIEFVAYHQTVQSGAGVQRLGCWIDEESPWAFYDEQQPRLIAEDGDLLMSYTPANSLTWSFDELFERAQLYLRTSVICDFLKEQDKKEVKQVEWTDSEQEIVVLQAATDDNPTLSRKAIEKKYVYDDPDTLATRRYGIFKQVTGRIFSEFSYKIHVLDFFKYFESGIPV